jgi:hypothetical protein
MPSEAERLLAAPDYHFLTFEGDSALFLPMSRAAYHESAFLDRRAKALSQMPLREPVKLLIDAAQRSTPPRLGWIFHVAHCGSTLLSRMIDSVESSLVLREPPPLRQLGLAAAAELHSPDWQDRLRLAQSMAARRFNPDRPTIVKANVPVNFMLDELRELDPAAPSILLYQPFEAYLVSILRAPQHRTWVERISDQVAPALLSEVGLNKGSSLPERAAALWLYQMFAFNKLLAANAAARSLNSRDLFEEPVETAKAVAAHLSAFDADVEGNAASLLGRYAKDTRRAFTDEDRRARDIDDRRRLSEEISLARHWLDGNSTSSSLPERLGNSLVGNAPALLE